MKRIQIMALLALFLATALPLRSAATWQSLMNYQGRLTDSLGESVPDGAYTITFNIYTLASGGASLWNETQSVSVTRGLFNAVLGSVNPLNAIAASNYSNDLYLGITMSGDSEMAPRQQLLPATYSKNSLMLQGLVPDNTAGNLVVLNGTGKIPAGLIAGTSLSAPFDMSALSATHVLNVNNSSASASAVGLKASGSNAFLATASDPSGYAIWGVAAGGTALTGQSASGVGVSATTQSNSSPALFASSAFPARFISNAAVAGSNALQASTAAGDYAVNLADRGAKAGLYAAVTAAGAAGVSTTAAAGPAIFGSSASSSASDAGVIGANTGNPTAGIGVLGNGFMGVQGNATQANGQGVNGQVASAISNAIGVLGLNANATGTGTVGRHTGTGAGQGVRGGSATGVGAIGVFGTVSATTASGVQGYANGTASLGVYGLVTANDSVAVLGQTTANAPSASLAAVMGKTKDLSTGTGLRGEANQGVYGISGGSCGVCGVNVNGATGVGVLANSPYTALQADSTNTLALGFGVNASVASTVDNSVAGKFQANGSSGVTYALYASNNSAAGYGLYSQGGLHSVHSRAVFHGTNFYSDEAMRPDFGFYHYDTNPPPGGIGVYASENCDDCFGGYFANSSGSGSGAALSVVGRLRVQLNTGAGTFIAPNGATTFTLNNSYIIANSLIFLTVASPTTSVAAVTSKGAGTATITFSPALAADTTYQFLIIGQ